MPLPDPNSKAPFVSAIKRICRTGVQVTKVVRVYSAGEELAECNTEGTPCDTVLFLDEHEHPKLALLQPGGTVEVHPGWSLRPTVD